MAKKIAPYLLFLAALVPFLEVFRQYQFISAVALSIYLLFIGFHLIEKEDSVRGYVAVSVGLFAAVAFLSKEFLLFVPLSLLPPMLDRVSEKNHELALRSMYLVWTSAVIAFLLGDAEGSAVTQFHYYAPLFVSVFAPLSIMIADGEAATKAATRPPTSISTIHGKSPKLLEKGKADDISQEELPQQNLIEAVLRLDYRDFDGNSAISTTLETLHKASNAYYAAYYRLDDKNGEYILESVAGKSPLKLQKSYPVGMGMVGQLYTSGDYIYANGLIEKETNDAKRKLLHGMDALLSIPVFSKQEQIGGIYIGLPKMSEDAQSMTIFLCRIAAERLGREFERMDTHSKVEKKSQTDKLTGLYNRQFFDEVLEEEFQKSQKEGSFLAYVLLDLDYFKQMNDTHGHDFGDKVLVEAANAFKKNVRPTDYVCRTGGDEFSLLLPGADKKAAYGIVKRIRDDYAQAVEKHHLYAMHDGKEVKSSLSIGVAVAPHPKATSGKALVKLGDLAVYHVKENGKNSFCFVE